MAELENPGQPQAVPEGDPSDPLLSVVIPVFNGTEYLQGLFDTLRKQQHVPDEIIVIDDGSTDGSSEMAERLGSGMRGLRIVRQENQGQAVARNAGLRHAKGRYLAFLDVDDFLDPAAYATLADLAENEQLDIAMANAWNFYEGRKADTLIYQEVPDTGVISGEAWFQQRWLSRYLPHYCWMHVYRRSFIAKHGFLFPIADPHEDVVWVTETLLAARRFHFIPKPMFWYRRKETWVFTPRVVAQGGKFVRHKTVEATMINARALAEIASNETLQPLTRKLIRREFVNSGCLVVRQIRKLSDPAQKAHYLKRVLEERFFHVLWSNAAGISQYWRVFRYHVLAYMMALRVRP